MPALQVPGWHCCSAAPTHIPPLFAATRPAGAGLALLPCLTDTDLQQMGITALGARKKLLLAAEELMEAAEAAVAAEVVVTGCDSAKQEGDEHWQGDEDAVAAAAAARGAPASVGQQEEAAALLTQRRQSHAQAGSSGVGDWRALGMGAGGAAVPCSILQYFKPTGSTKKSAVQPTAKPGCILSYLKAADGSSLPVPRSAQQQQGAGRGKGKQQQWAHKAVAADGGGGGGKRWGPR